MIKKFKLFKESLLDKFKSPELSEILENIGADKMLIEMINQNNIDGINYAIEHGADEKVYLEYKPMLDLIGKKVFCVRVWSQKKLFINCSIFTNENVGGYGCGITGNYFSVNDFKKSFIDKTGDSNGRYLYTLEQLPLMYIKFGLNNNKIKENIKLYRKSTNQGIIETERKFNCFVEIEDIFK